MQQDLILALNDKIPLLPIAEVKELNGNVVCFIGLWCNGSTTGFGSVCPGSSPGSPTKKIIL